MKKEKSIPYDITLITLVGKDPKNLRMLGVLSQSGSDPGSGWSVIVKFSAPLPAASVNQRNPIYRVRSWLTSMDESPLGDLYAVSIDGKLHYTNQGKWKVINLRRFGLGYAWA